MEKKRKGSLDFIKRRQKKAAEDEARKQQNQRGVEPVVPQLARQERPRQHPEQRETQKKGREERAEDRTRLPGESVKDWLRRRQGLGGVEKKKVESPVQRPQRKPPEPTPVSVAESSVENPPKEKEKSSLLERELSPESGERAIANFFESWCNKGGALMMQIDHFATKLKEKQRGLEVSVLYRERDALNLTFATEARDPVEYWLVKSGSELLLFPRPQNSTKFKELDPVFSGNATPSTLSKIVPAKIEKDLEFEYRLSKKGEIS